MTSLLNSALLALGSLAIALPLGTLLAVLLTRFRIPGRQLAIVCIGALLFIPLYIQLSAWDAALGKLGWFTLAYGSLAQPILSGMRGAILVHGMAAIPWVAFLVGIGLMQVDSVQEEAALLVAPPRLVLRRITLPQTLPFIGVAAIWTVLSTTSDITATNIYLINPEEWTLTERFYMSWSLNLSPTSKADVTLGLGVLALLVGTILWFIGRPLRKQMPSVRLGARPFSSSISLSAAVIVWVIVLVLLGVPLASLAGKAGFVVVHDGDTRRATWSAAKCLGEVLAAPQRFFEEIRGTVLIAIGAASVTLAASILLVWPARRGGWQAGPLIAAVVLATAIPGPLVGVFLINLFNHDLPPRVPWDEALPKSWLLILYDNTPVVPIMAQAIRALPLTIMILWHSFATLSDDVLSAAALEGLSPGRVLWNVALPQRWRAVATAWIVAFAVAAGDLAWCHLVTPPGLDLLSRRIFGLVHSGVEEQVAAISLVVVMVYGLFAGVVLWLIERQQRLANR